MATAESQTSQTFDNDVVWYDVDSIKPAPENERLYRPIDPDDPDIQRLADSVRAKGILEPLVISRDGFILSGHRRHCAAKIAGMQCVPCREVPVSREDDIDEFLRLLRDFNRQRVKSFAEVVREEVVDVSADDAYERLLSQRAAKSKLAIPQLSLGRVKARKRISAAKMPMLDAIVRIVNSMREYLPITERKIHYKLLNDPPLRHASKPGSHYANDRNSQGDLSDLCTRARLAGLIPMEAIDDETRPVVVWNTHRSADSFVRREFDGFLRGYWRDLMQSQFNHVEILVEKNTIASIINPIAMEFCVPMTSGRGYASLPPRYQMAQRFEKSGSEKLVLLIVSDFDPDGEKIAESFARSMRDDFSLEVHPIKVALTHAQTKRFNLRFPLDIRTKKSKNKKWFQDHYGTDSYELEALDEPVLQGLVRNAIESVIDVDAYNREVDAEKADAVHIEGLRQAALRMIGDLGQ